MKELTLIDKAFLLKKTPLFASLDIDLLLAIADKFEAESYKKGTKVFEIDQEAGRLYLLVEGFIEIKNRQKMPLAELRPLDFFGEEAILSERKRGYEAYCLTDAFFLTIAASHFFAILNECPSLALYLLEAYSTAIDFRKR